MTMRPTFLRPRRLAGLSLALSPLFFASTATAQNLQTSSSEIVWLDLDKEALLVDPPSSEVRNGDRACLLSAWGTLLTCDVRAQKLNGKDFLFVPRPVLSKLSVGRQILVKKIFLAGQGDENPYLSPNLFESQLRQLKSQGETQKQLEGELKDKKLPGGDEPEPIVEPTEFKAEDFPEIYLPKPSSKGKAPSGAADKTKQTTDAIRKIFQDKASEPISFAESNRANETSAEESEVAADRPSIEPAPIRYDIFTSLLSQRALVPTVDLTTLRFRTLEADELTRTSLWKANRTTLHSQSGIGFEIGVIRNQARYVSLGWRRQSFSRIASETRYDAIDERFLTRARTEALQQASSLETGWIWPLFPLLSLKLGLGLDAYDTQIRFRSEVAGLDPLNPQLLAYGNTRLLHLSTRSLLGLELHTKSVAWILSLQAGLPLGVVQKSFEGGVNVPDRISFQGSARSDLDQALAHRLHPYTFEGIIGVQYVPHR